MFATVFNLPKWLLATVVFCIGIGHFQQVECKVTGCSSVAVDASAKAPVKGDPAPTGETGHCDCQCHFSVATFEVSQPFAVVRFARQMRMIERSISAPEAPCAKIEYPPKSVQA